MPLRTGSPLPPLTGATQWLGSGQPEPDELAGRPVLVHFWAVSCHICHETMPDLMRYRQQYAPQGLQFIAVHMPRQEEDLDVSLVQKDVLTYNITQPVALDHAHQVADAFQNQFVPAFFLFDATHKLTFRAAGDKGFSSLQPKIEQLLNAATTP